MKASVCSHSRLDDIVYDEHTIDCDEENLCGSIHSYEQQTLCVRFSGRTFVLPEGKLMRMSNDVMVTEMFRSHESLHTRLTFKQTIGTTMFCFVLFQFVFPIATRKQISSSKTDQSIMRSKYVSGWSHCEGIPIWSVQIFVSITSTPFPGRYRANRREWVCSGTTSSIASEKKLGSWSNETIVLVPLRVPACHFTSVSLIEMKEVGLSSVSVTSNPLLPLSIEQWRSEREAEQNILKVSSPRKLILPGKCLLTIFASTFKRFVVGMLGHIVSVEMKGRFEC